MGRAGGVSDMTHVTAFTMLVQRQAGARASERNSLPSWKTNKEPHFAGLNS
jgi:hypothetical protein